MEQAGLQGLASTDKNFISNLIITLFPKSARRENLSPLRAVGPYGPEAGLLENQETRKNQIN